MKHFDVYILIKWYVKIGQISIFLVLNFGHDFDSMLQVLDMYYGGGVCGYDKDGDPILLDPAGHRDWKGWLAGCTNRGGGGMEGRGGVCGCGCDKGIVIGKVCWLHQHFNNDKNYLLISGFFWGVQFDKKRTNPPPEILCHF